MLQLRSRHGARIQGRVFTAKSNVRTGRLIRSRSENIITQLGLGRINTAVFDAASSLITACKVGSGLTVPADTDTGLTTLVASKTISDKDDSNVTGSNPYYFVRTQFNESEAIGTLHETGLFFTDGVMFNHALFGMGVPTAATQANPVVITTVGHGLEEGQRVRFDGVGGMTDLNFVATNYYFVKPLDDDDFELYEDEDLTVTLDGTGFSAFTSGGTWKISINKTSSDILAVRFEIELANA